MSVKWGSLCVCRACTAPKSSSGAASSCEYPHLELVPQAEQFPRAEISKYIFSPWLWHLLGNFKLRSVCATVQAFTLAQTCPQTWKPWDSVRSDCNWEGGRKRSRERFMSWGFVHIAHSKTSGTEWQSVGITGERGQSPLINDTQVWWFRRANSSRLRKL